MSGKQGGGSQGVPLWAVNGPVEIADHTRELTEAVECAQVASHTCLTDPMEFMHGTLAILLAASENVANEAEKLQCRAERGIE